jgi:hypothetical protein
MISFKVSSKKEQFEIKMVSSQPGGTSYNKIVEGNRIESGFVKHIFTHKIQEKPPIFAVSCELTGGRIYTGFEGESRKNVIKTMFEMLTDNDHEKFRLLNRIRQETCGDKKDFSFF